MPRVAPPKVRLSIGEPPREYSVEFNLDTMLRIEEATGRSIMDLVALAAIRDAGEGRVAAVVRRYPLGVVIDIVRGAVGANEDQGRAWAEDGHIYRAFTQLLGPFVEAAANLFGSAAEEAPEGNQGPTPAAGSGAASPAPPPDGESAPATSAA